MRNAHIVAGWAVLLFGAATIIAAWTTLPYTGEFGPDSGFLPLWLGVILMVASVPVIRAAFRARGASDGLFRPETVTCLKVLALIVAAFLLLPVLGFPVALALITAGGMRIMGRHGWASCAVTALGTAVCIHYLFGQWLGIPLPKGMIGW